MNNIDYTFSRIKEIYKLRRILEKSYADDPTRIKGRAYQKKVAILEGQLAQQLQKIKNFGTDGKLWRITLMDLETQSRKYSYFLNINKDSINTLCEIKFPGWSIINIQQVNPGQLLG